MQTIGLKSILLGVVSTFSSSPSLQINEEDMVSGIVSTPKRPPSPRKSGSLLQIRLGAKGHYTQQELHIKTGPKAIEDAHWPIRGSPKPSKQDAKKKQIHVPSVGHFLRGSIKTGVKAKDKGKLPKDEVLIFTVDSSFTPSPVTPWLFSIFILSLRCPKAIHGFSSSTEREPRKIVLTVKRGDSTFTESDAWD